MSSLFFTALFLATATIIGHAQTQSADADADATLFPKADWVDAPNPLASPDAQPGGTLSVYSAQYPQSLNVYLDNNSFSSEVFGSMYETLLGSSALTVDYEPALAERWSISADKQTFTFWIDPAARWSDGRPITAADVRWTFDAIMNPTNITGPHKVALQVFDPPEVVSTNIIRFHAREVHWRNLSAAGGFHILPSHLFATQDFNKINFEFPVISGPYRRGELKEGVSLRLERRPDWWARRYQRTAHIANFDTILFRFYAEQENAFEAFKKGLVDYFPVYMARLWVNEAQGERFDKNWIVKQRVENYNPIGFQGFAMNMRRPPFDDVRVRQAICHLIDRERMNQTIMYGQYFLHRSYFEDLYSPDSPPDNPVFPFDKDKARALLHDAGWLANPTTGILEKDGTPFTFRFLSRDASTDKFLAIFSEDLKDVGIRLETDKKDWAAWTKDMESFNFDMTWAAWGAGLFKDPEDMWSSREAERQGGNNITGFKNDEVDALIDKQKTLFDVAERHEMARQIDRIVTRQCPYALLWNINASRLLYWNKFGMPPTVLGKYGDERAAYWLWWYDPDSDAELQSATSAGDHLAPRPPRIVFDEVFRAPLQGGPGAPRTDTPAPQTAAGGPGAPRAGDDVEVPRRDTTATSLE